MADFVVTSQRGSSFSMFSSLKALFNPSKQIFGAYERPPFPIIVD